MHPNSFNYYSSHIRIQCCLWRMYFATFLTKNRLPSPSPNQRGRAQPFSQWSLRSSHFGFLFAANFILIACLPGLVSVGGNWLPPIGRPICLESAAIVRLVHSREGNEHTTWSFSVPLEPSQESRVTASAFPQDVCALLKIEDWDIFNSN